MKNEKRKMKKEDYPKETLQTLKLCMQFDKIVYENMIYNLGDFL
jgi:hypothetical protein